MSTVKASNLDKLIDLSHNEAESYVSSAKGSPKNSIRSQSSAKSPRNGNSEILGRYSIKKIKDDDIHNQIIVNQIINLDDGLHGNQNTARDEGQ